MIIISYRHFDTHIKSLLHFDYPYYGEPHDGLNDEILSTIWTRSGNVRLSGSEIPADIITSGTPKFGYRCLFSEGSADYISANTDAFTMTEAGSYEVFCYVRPHSSQSGNIFALFNGAVQLLAVSLSSGAGISVTCPDWELAADSARTLSLDTWHQLAVRFAPQNVSIIIDGNTEDFPITSRTALTPSSARIGGLRGYIDEFMFRDNFSTSLPDQPVQAALNVSELGGFGNGSLGSVNITSNIIMNSSGYMPDSQHITNIQEGYFGGFTAGQEVLMLGEDGSYCFRHITAINGSVFTFSSTPSNSFPAQAFTVPNFRELTISSSVRLNVRPYHYSGKLCGGVVVFRVSGSCSIDGKIVTNDDNYADKRTGRTRTDYQQMTHAKLIDSFITSGGGNIMIFCGGTLTISSSARLGSEWDGSAAGGAGSSDVYTRGFAGHAGAGYGGGGGGYANYPGGSGGVGGGGGGSSLTARGGDAGTGGTGGISGSGSKGGTQALTIGARAELPSDDGNFLGGGGAGGMVGGYTVADIQTVSPGANIIIAAKTLHADAAAVSTGGAGGWSDTNSSLGGSGTGFCYIACEVMN